MHRLLVLVLVASAAATRLFPVAGCWEMDADNPGHCVQHWGYQMIGTGSETLPLGPRNHMLFDGRLTNAIIPPTEFSVASSSRDLFETRAPCSGSLVWNLNGHVAHARVGQASHHCSHKATPFSARAVAEYFPPVLTGECTQQSLSLADNNNCLRLDHEIKHSLVHTQVLDISLSTLPRTCQPGSSVDVSLSWALLAGCDQTPLTTETFATVTVDCGVHDLHFGIDGRVGLNWAPQSGVATAPHRNGDQGGHSLVRALDRIAEEPLLVYYSVIAHADGLEARVQGAVVRTCVDAAQHLLHTAASRSTAVIEPIAECTSRLDELHGGTPSGDLCRSWFGYRMTGASQQQHRPVSESNTFLTTPYDRGQPVYFTPGEHRYAFSVVWNCSDYGEPTGPMLTWKLDTVTTANRRGPLCRVGCDGVQGSDKQYDRCGVCGGTGSTCAHVIRGLGELREYCDGDHERNVQCSFDATTGQPTQSGVKITESILSTAQPVRESLGMPNVDFGGPGQGIGGSRSGSGRNTESSAGVLAFSTPQPGGCLRVQFDRPVHLRSATILGVQPFCGGDGTQVCVLSSDCENPGEVCQDGLCVMRLANDRDARTLDAQQQTIMEGYVSRGYVLSEEGWRCSEATECDDGQVCTIDVCVCTYCMHRRNEWCCDRDDQCPFALDACEIGICDPEIHRCDTARVDDPLCCSPNYPCDALSESQCMETLCVNNQCTEVPVSSHCCETADDCPHDPCGVTSCVDNECKIDMIPNCCTSDAGCPAQDNVCLESHCVDGLCSVTEVDNCCLDNDACTSTSACILANCTNNQCVRSRIPGCCETVVDCGTVGSCVSVDCIDGQCKYDAINECCESDEACALPNPCIQSSCNLETRTCVHDAIGECCTSDDMCPSTSICVTSSCDIASQRCVPHPIPNCCLADDDCPASSLACVTAYCNTESNVCVYEGLDDCCRNSSWCNDNDVCTADVCLPDATCSNPVIEDCCRCDQDCNDNDVCTLDVCSNETHTCSNPPIDGCCTETSQCAPSQFPCAEAVCDLGIQRCVLQPVGHLCCTSDPQCEVLNTECVVGTCDEEINECSFGVVGGCCDTDVDCGIPANGCFLTACVNHTCEIAEMNCDDEDPCTDDVCQAGVCLNVAKQCMASTNPCEENVCIEGECTTVSLTEEPGCCDGYDNTACADRGPCLEAWCVQSNCIYVPTDEGCCTNVTDCENIIPEVPHCSVRACNNNQCVVIPDSLCCFSSNECPPPPGPCQIYQCNNGTCTLGPDPTCCTTTNDCTQFPPEACLDLTGCVEGQCQYESRIPCCSVSSDCNYLLDQIQTMQNASCFEAQCNNNTGLCEIVDVCPPPNFCDTVDDCHPQTLCTVATCVDNHCSYAPLDCDDGIPCSIDACAQGICVNDMDPCFVTPSQTPSVSVSSSAQPTPSSTASVSASVSTTPTRSLSPTPTPSAPVTHTPTTTSQATGTPSPTAQATRSSSATPSASVSATPSITASPSTTPSQTATPTAPVTPSPTVGVSASVTPSNSPTASVTASTSASASASSTRPPSASRTPSSSTSSTHTPSRSTTSSRTPSKSPGPTPSGKHTSQSRTPSRTPSVTPTPPQKSPSRSQWPGWGWEDPNHNHTGPPGWPEGRPFPGKGKPEDRSAPAPKKINTRKLLSLGEVADVFRPRPLETRSAPVSSGLQRSWLAVYGAGNAPMRREQVPPAAANNGVTTVELSADSVTALELCTCSGEGGIVSLDYLHTGSAAVYDRCGVCGGDGSSCHFAPVDSVRIQTRLATQPLSVRVVQNDDNDVYEICYYHARLPTDTIDYEGHVVRIGFEPHQSCSSVRSGMCDSIPALAPSDWCRSYNGGPGDILTPAWNYEELGLPNDIDCSGDKLFTCPVGDGSAGYRVCRNISLSDMLLCNLRDGVTRALGVQMMTDHSVQYTGTIHATELQAVDCTDPSRCERVLHRTNRRVRVRSSPGTGRMTADFDSDNIAFEATVNGVTCDPRGDTVRVHFATKVSAPWGRSVYVEPPVANVDGVVITATGFSDPIESGRSANPCIERTAGTVPVCTQLWTAQLPATQIDVQLMAAAHVDDQLLAQTPLVMNLNAAVPCTSIDFALTGVRSNERRLADSGLILYYDAARLDAYIPDLASFPDGATVYGRIMSAVPPTFASSNTFTMVLDEFHICYPFEGASSYIPYDVQHPLATGCMSPGDWMVTTLYRRGVITSDGERIRAVFPPATDLTLDFQFVAFAATTNAPVYIDARWHVDWAGTANARRFASDRLSRHRSAAISAGRPVHDFGEPLSGYHSILTPEQMEQTRRLPELQKDRVRTMMTIHTAVQTGLSADGLRSIYNGSVGVVRSDAVTRQYGAYNDDVWYSSGYGYYSSNCIEEHAADNDWAVPLTKSACKHCKDCDDLKSNHSMPCVWPCDGECWPFVCDDDDDDDTEHLWWLWLLPFAVGALLLCWWPWYEPRPPRRYTHVRAAAVRTPTGTAAVATVHSRRE